MDHLIDVALANGAIAPKVCGAGGGGCIAFYCEDGLRNDVETALSNEEGVRVLDCSIDPDGLTLTISSPHVSVARGVSSPHVSKGSSKPLFILKNGRTRQASQNYSSRCFDFQNKSFFRRNTAMKFINARYIDVALVTLLVGIAR